MRILIHGINFSPELTGIGKYSGEMAEWLSIRGHEVRVVTAPPYYPQWMVAEGYRNGWSKDKDRGLRPQGPSLGILGDKSPVPERRAEGKGLRTEQGGSLAVYRCPLWVPAKPSGLKRVLHLASFALSSLPIMLRQIFWRPDVVLVVEPPLFCAPQAWLVARLSGGKAWLHIQDYEVDAAFDLGLLKGVVLRDVVTAGERWLMRRFDRVSTISQRMLNRMLVKGVGRAHAVHFPNWVEITTGGRVQTAKVFTEQLMENTPSCSVKDSVLSGTGLSGYRAELGIAADAVVALYSGNMGGKQGLEILAQAAVLGSRIEDRDRKGLPRTTEGHSSELLREGLSCQTTSFAGLEPCSSSLKPEIVFVFCGNGAGRDDLVRQCAGLFNVKFMDLQPLERLDELLSFADIHLLPQRADAADLVMPSKLTGMLASGRPVVATARDGTELANVVAGCGLVVLPEQPQALADAIRTLANDAALRTTLGSAGRAYAETNLDKEVVLERFEAEMKFVTKKK